MGSQRVIQGTVVTDKMEKTVVVSVERTKKHRLYHKVVNVHRPLQGARRRQRLQAWRCRPHPGMPPVFAR